MDRVGYSLADAAEETDTLETPDCFVSSSPPRGAKVRSDAPSGASAADVRSTSATSSLRFASIAVATDSTHSRWVARGPMGTTVEWDAEIFNERPNELIAWRSLEGSEIACAGSVRFRPAPDGRGTELQVSLSYEPPAGEIGASIAWLFGEEPRLQIAEDLARFKATLEGTETTPADGPPGA